jgi:stress response protein YsnF
VVLHEERPVVGKEAVAKERVRLGTETQRSEERISEQVRKEEIDTDGAEGVADRDARTRNGSQSERSEAWR